MREVQAGDYLYIISYDGTYSNHGFIVAGWAKIDNCANAINKAVSGTPYAIYDPTPGASNDPASTLYPRWDTVTGQVFVPYVADYSRTSTGWVQHPVPRPFYCSAFQYGSPVTPTSPSSQSFTVGHDWFFYTLPDSIVIEYNQLFVDTSWRWADLDGR